MPQFTRFLRLPEGDAHTAVSALIAVCRAVPETGVPFKELRQLMRDRKLWAREHGAALLAFLQLPATGTAVPSPVTAAVATAQSDAAARDVLAERLWQVNPILFRAVVLSIAEHVYARDEIIKQIGSFSYPGERPTRPELEAWLRLAEGLEIVRMVGIAFSVGERGRGFVDRARDLDIDEFLAEDEPEPAVVLTTPAEPQEPVPAAVEAAPAPAAPAVALASPLGRERPVPVSRFAGAGLFGDELLDATAARIAGWWADQPAGARALRIGDFGLDAESWMEASEEALYRAAVAAALAFRLRGGREAVVAAFVALDRAGVLGDLYYGTAPEALPDGIDSQALMLASLVARRCAESPELGASLEKQATAREAFAVLEEALGRGLLKIELFWLLDALAELGALRFDDLGDFTALPTRAVRDTLFRLGFVTTPYAHDAASLLPAARAARRASGGALPPHEVLEAFALAAGCAYDCPHRRRCDFACRERAE